MRLFPVKSYKGLAAFRLFTVVSIACAVAACQSSRFDSGAGMPRSQAGAGWDLEPGIGAAPVGRVESSPLPPADGAAGMTDPAFPHGQSSDGAIIAGLPPAQEPLGGTPAPSAPPPATRSSAVGRWTAKEAAGNCGVTLSSTPSLDLYRASTSGCSNKDLQSVNAWEFRDGEIYLYARGGVVARLRDSGGQFNGVLAKSGAPLTLSK